MIASRPIRLQTIQHHRRQDKIERDSFFKVDSSGFSGGTSWTNHKASKDGHTKRNDQSIQPSLSLACVYFICLFCLSQSFKQLFYSSQHIQIVPLVQKKTQILRLATSCFVLVSSPLCLQTGLPSKSRSCKTKYGSQARQMLNDEEDKMVFKSYRDNIDEGQDRKDRSDFGENNPPNAHLSVMSFVCFVVYRTSRASSGRLAKPVTTNQLVDNLGRCRQVSRFDRTKLVTLIEEQDQNNNNKTTLGGLVL